MNALNLLTRFYGLLHNYEGVPFWALTPLRKLTRSVANRVLPKYLSRVHKQDKNSGEGIIVSFTSYPARINIVWQVVESLKRQSIKPEKIILWLSKEQFNSCDDIPQSLRDCEDKVFSIRIVEGDIRSHKKYFYAMQEYPENVIVTCDDDVYYHPDTLSCLIETSKVYPGCIIANVSSQLKYDNNNELLPYLQWGGEFKPYSSLNNVQIGIGGVLYPPHSIHQIAFRQECFMKVAPMADDLWLSMAARLNNTPVVQTGKNILFLEVQNEGKSLSSVNNGSENMNDCQIKQIREWLKAEGFKDVFDSNYVVESQYGGGKIVVSLTSFPARIDNVWQVVECMKRQTLKPRKIILWLSKDQFPLEGTIPQSLKEREDDVFEIRVVEGDIRSHKKYHYVSKEYADDYVFLIDDDIYYSTTILENTWRAHLIYPEDVICNYGYIIRVNELGNLTTYNSWKPVYEEMRGNNLFFGSGGGTLFKPREMYEDLTNIEQAMDMAPTADDIWLNAMAKKAGKQITLLRNGYILPIANKENITLSSVNVGKSQNDVQLKRVWDYYNLNNA